MNKNSVSKTQKKTKWHSLPTWARWIIISFLIVLAFLLIIFLLKPLRTFSSKKFVSVGDEYLASKKYLHADLAYEKALLLSPKNSDILAKRALAKSASEDIEKLESFFQEEKFSANKEALLSASEFPSSETDALKLCKELIEKGEYQLAIIPAHTATEMDPGYRDAWLYLGIANLKTAQLVELSPEVKQAYMNKAKEALQRAKEIDPESKAVADYQKQVN